MLRDAFAQAEPPSELTAPAQQTLRALLDAGHEVFVRRGYHRTRVDDIVELAGVSHGAFYRYFDNKDQLARILTARAMRTVGQVFTEIPPMEELASPTGRANLRRWLRRYHETQTDEAAMLQVWVDASLQDAELRANSAPAIDWGRRHLAGFLRPRGFGDIDTEALVMVAVLNAAGRQPTAATPVDAAMHLIEQGLLGSGTR